MSLLIVQVVALFIIIYLYLSSAKIGDGNDFISALVLAIAIPLLGILPIYIGVIGWLVAIIVALILISKVTGQSIAGSVLFLIVIGFIQYLVQIGLSRFIKF